MTELITRLRAQADYLLPLLTDDELALHVEAADALEAAQASAGHVEVVRGILTTSERELGEERAKVRALAREVVKLAAERDAEAALADQLAAHLADWVAWADGSHDPTFALSDDKAALAAHRERREVAA